MASKKRQITPMDIHNKEFTRRGRNGYDRYEVDSFLDDIVDSYGDTLDEMIDLKNQIVAQDEKIEKLQSQVDDYNKKKMEVNDVLVSARQSANELKLAAEKEAAQIIEDAKKQAETDTNFQKQQQETISADYKRIKEEVAVFRKHIQDLLEKQINDLSDENWQHTLDEFYHTERFYPGDGSEPLSYAQSQEEEFARESALDDEIDDDEPDIIDNEDLDGLNSTQEPDDLDSSSTILSGDSPSQETVDRSNPEINFSDNAPTIVFPDNYKDHN